MLRRNLFDSGSYQASIFMKIILKIELIFFVSFHRDATEITKVLPEKNQKSQSSILTKNTPLYAPVFIPLVILVFKIVKNAKYPRL